MLLLYPGLRQELSSRDSLTMRAEVRSQVTTPLATLAFDELYASKDPAVVGAHIGGFDLRSAEYPGSLTLVMHD
jgi:hypothetical protein